MTYQTRYGHSQGAVMHRGYGIVSTNLGSLMMNYFEYSNQPVGGCTDPFVGGKCVVDQGFDFVIGGMSQGGGIATVLGYDYQYYLADKTNRLYYAAVSPSRSMRDVHMNDYAPKFYADLGGSWRVGLMGSFWKRCSWQTHKKRHDPTVNAGCDCKNDDDWGIPNNGKHSSVGPKSISEFHDNYWWTVQNADGWIFSYGYHYYPAEWYIWFQTSSNQKKDYARSSHMKTGTRCVPHYGGSGIDSWECNSSNYCKTCKLRYKLGMLGKEAAFMGLHNTHLTTLAFGSPKVAMPQLGHDTAGGWND